MEEQEGGEEAGLVRRWVDLLNEFSRSCVDEWANYPHCGRDGRRGGEALMAYGHRLAMDGRTVIVQTHLVDGEPSLPSDSEPLEAKRARHDAGEVQLVRSMCRDHTPKRVVLSPHVHMNSPGKFGGHDPPPRGRSTEPRRSAIRTDSCMPPPLAWKDAACAHSRGGAV